MLDRLERKFGKYAIENLYIYIIILSGAVSFLAILGIGPVLGNIGRAVSHGEWWQVFLYPFQVAHGDPNSFFSPPIRVLFVLYGIWIFSGPLEAAIGAFRFNLFIFLGLIFTTVPTLLYFYYSSIPLPGISKSILSYFLMPVPALYIVPALLFACAYEIPRMELLLFFILPVQLRWIAIVTILLIIVQTLRGVLESSYPGLFFIPLYAFANFLILYLPTIVRNFRNQAGAKVRKQNFQVSRRAIHNCVICGLTEHDDPQMDFRYCVDCSDHEYCMNHLSNHEHIK